MEERTVPTNAADNSPRIHLDFLDGIRGLAALYVVLHHLYGLQFGLTARPGLRGWTVNWLLYGHLAVDVFIVLSGFCLAIPAARSGHINGGAREFLKRRARRILPPYYICFFLCIVLLFIEKAIRHTHGLPFTVKGLVVNALLLQDLFPGLNSQFNPPFWSIAVEWKIYLLFPVLFFVWRRYGYAAMIGVSVVVAFVATQGICRLRPGISLGHTCPWYVVLFALGMATGLFTFDRRTTVVTNAGEPVFEGPSPKRAGGSLWCAAILAPTLLLLLATYPITSGGEEELYVPHLPLIDITAGALACSLLRLMSCFRCKQGRLLTLLCTRRPLVTLGTFAYSLYLVHFPVIGCLLPLLHKMPGVKDHAAGQGAVIVFIALPLVLCVAYVFFCLFERPLLSAGSGRRLSQDRTAAI